MIKETITVYESSELRKANKARYEMIILEGTIKKEMVKSMGWHKSKPILRKLTNVAIGAGVVSLALTGIGAPYAAGTVSGLAACTAARALFRDTLKHYTVEYCEEADTLRLLYKK